jgi:hypothetical protein
MLVHLYQIPRDSASHRVAKIENTFWEGNIAETDEHTGRRRSSAILKRVHRPRPTR